MKHILIIGERGSGKTTLVNHIVSEVSHTFLEPYCTAPYIEMHIRLMDIPKDKPHVVVIDGMVISELISERMKMVLTTELSVITDINGGRRLITMPTFMFTCSCKYSDLLKNNAFLNNHFHIMEATNL